MCSQTIRFRVVDGQLTCQHALSGRELHCAPSRKQSGHFSVTWPNRSTSLFAVVPETRGKAKDQESARGSYLLEEVIWPSIEMMLFKFRMIVLRSIGTCLVICSRNALICSQLASPKASKSWGDGGKNAASTHRHVCTWAFTPLHKKFCDDVDDFLCLS